MSLDKSKTYRTKRRKPSVVEAIQSLLKDSYHFLISSSWPVLIGILFLTYVVINLIFAKLYVLGGDCILHMRPDSEENGAFLDAFFFSVQTITTVGYGNLSPKTDYASAIAAIEAFIGIMSMAMVTGLVFSKFARPRARVLFTERAVVHTSNELSSLMIRLSNKRNSRIVDAKVVVTLSHRVELPNGEYITRFTELKLCRARTPIFNNMMTVMHDIDNDSPLKDETIESLEKKSAEINVTLSGVDENVAQEIHARHVYYPDDIAWGYRFVRLESCNTQREMDDSFHDIEPSD